MLFSYQYFRQIYVAFGLLLFIVCGGTFGFMLVENYTLLEGFYMTIISVSTVGFQEVRPLSDAGRLFTSFLIISSFGTFAFAISSITKYVVGGEYRTYFKDYRVNKIIEKMQGHVIVCGYGRNGKQAAETLKAHGKAFIIMETNPNVLEKLRNEKSVTYMEGDATIEVDLLKAGITRASSLITTLPKDSDNLFVVLTARELNRKLDIVSRASQSGSDRKLKIAGADKVIMPDKIGGEHMAQLVVMPDVTEFLDQIKIQGRGVINLEEIRYENIPENFKHRTLRELEGEYKTGALIIGFKTADGEFIINPSADTELIPDSKLFVLGSPEQILRLNNVFKVTTSI